MNKYLFFDTETTGLDQEIDHIVQLAAILTDETGKQLDTMDRIILPIGFTIPKESTKIHGISQSEAISKGIPIDRVIDEFMAMVLKADYLVAHNFQFDFGFVMEEIMRTRKPDFYIMLSDIPYHCTMQSTTEFCKIGYNSKYKTYKWPKLIELYQKLFTTIFYGAHNALIDVEATIRCFFELKDKYGFYQPTTQPKI